MECEKLLTLADTEHVVVVVDFLKAAIIPRSDNQTSGAVGLAAVGRRTILSPQSADERRSHSQHGANPQIIIFV